MEYVQTALLQIEASRLEQASQARGRLAELDDTETSCGSSPASGHRITRSINNEGNVLVVVETRWSDDASLVRYETGDNNVARIIDRHSDVIARDSIQVLDMEALRTESSWRERKPPPKRASGSHSLLIPSVFWPSLCSLLRPLPHLPRDPG
jgi:hypothetical protein